MEQSGLSLSRLMWIGSIAWAVVLVGLLPFAGRLAEAGHTWWIWTCVAGIGLGLIGWELARRRPGR